MFADNGAARRFPKFISMFPVEMKVKAYGNGAGPSFTNICFNVQPQSTGVRPI